MSEPTQGQSFFTRFTEAIDDTELRTPDFLTVVKLSWYSIQCFFVERPGQIIGSAFILIMLWGPHGNLELLQFIWSAWRGPGIDIGTRPSLLPWIPWDQELISFWGGAFLLVIIPSLLITFGFKQPLAHYGLGLPPRGRRALAGVTFLTLTVVSLPLFWIGAHDPGMRALYPLYKALSGVGAFLLYELTYLPFFIAIEFIFRGYLLFGLAGIRDTQVQDAGGGFPGEFYFHRYALLIQMLSYTAWHLGKPLPELFGTLLWGLFAGATAYAIRSIWPIILSHWLLNVFLDAVIWLDL
jgi:hypothetical protein